MKWLFVVLVSTALLDQIMALYAVSRGEWGWGLLFIMMGLLAGAQAVRVFLSNNG